MYIKLFLKVSAIPFIWYQVCQDLLSLIFFLKNLSKYPGEKWTRDSVRPKSSQALHRRCDQCLAWSEKLQPRSSGPTDEPRQSSSHVYPLARSAVSCLYTMVAACVPGLTWETCGNWKCSKSVNFHPFWALFFFKLVRIQPAIHWYQCHAASVLGFKTAHEFVYGTDLWDLLYSLGAS